MVNRTVGILVDLIYAAHEVAGKTFTGLGRMSQDVDG